VNGERGGGGENRGAPIHGDAYGGGLVVRSKVSVHGSDQFTQRLSATTATLCRSLRSGSPIVAMMMSLEWLGASARYNRWMNDKLYGLAAGLTNEARKRDWGAFFKSLHGTFNHILLADKVWLARFKGLIAPSGFMAPGGIRSLDQELYADFEDLRRERALTDEELTAWVAGLTPDALAAPLVYTRRDEKIESPLWWGVAHLFNHQTHHRGQLTTLFTQQGCDPGATDLFAMLREERR
jgi:uncharacterized damage-inducible protein DinB